VTARSLPQGVAIACTGAKHRDLLHAASSSGRGSAARSPGEQLGLGRAFVESKMGAMRALPT